MQLIAQLAKTAAKLAADEKPSKRKPRAYPLPVIDERAKHWYNAPVSATIGRVLDLPAALLVGQEKALDWTTNPDKKMVQDVVAAMSKQYPAELANVAIRLGGTNTRDDIVRVQKNKLFGDIVRSKGLRDTPAINAMLSLNRATAYNPYSNTVTAYNNIPEVIAHELGHAVDFNRKTKWRSPYMFARGFEPLPGPFTLFQEGRASQLGTRALAEHAADPEVARRSAWRRLAPAFGTYLGATGSGAYLLSRALSGHRFGLPEAILTSLGGAAGGALGGRLVAEIRNLFNMGKLKPKEEEKRKEPQRQAA